MVGLPYPNIRSPELKEKMDYLNANMVSLTKRTVLVFSLCGWLPGEAKGER